MTKKDIIIVYKKLEDINPANYNPRSISEIAFVGLCESIKKFGFVEPVIINQRTNTLVGGHARIKAAQYLKIDTVPVVYVDLSLSEEKALNVTLNNQAISGTFTDALQELLQEIKIDLPEYTDLKLDALEIKLDDINNPDVPDAPKQKMSDTFGTAPFSILNAREGWWQDRKRDWLALGIKSELGRGNNMLDMSATMCGITDPVEREKWNANRRKVKVQTDE